MEIAGGHIDKFSIIEEGKKLVKTVKRGELEFYEEINSFQQEEIVKDLQNMIPSYYGIYQLEPIPQIILQNLLLDFKNPSILDVKMGFETFVPNASEKKRNSHTSKMQKTTSHSLGLRISGMIVHDMEGRYKIK